MHGALLVRLSRGLITVLLELVADSIAGGADAVQEKTCQLLIVVTLGSRDNFRVQ